MLKNVFMLNLLLTTISMKLDFFNFSKVDESQNEMDALGVGAIMPHEIKETAEHDSADVYGI